MSAGAERIWRASGEAILAATLLVFLFAYLNLNRWHVRYAHITIGWLVFLGALVAVALFDPAVASGIARLSLLLVAIAGFSLVVYLATHGYDRAVLLIPTWFLLVVWVIGGRPHGRRHGDERHRRARPARRPRADRHADRLHRDAARLRGRHHPRHRVRRRAPRARAHRRRRHDLGLGRVGRQGLHQSGDRAGARPQARHARRPGRALARGAPSARPRPLPRRARRRAGAAARPAGAGFPPAHARRPLSVVHPQGASGRRLRRRGRAPRRHAHRRDRVQDRRGAAAARRGARQSHRPAQPSALPRPARGRARLRQGRSRHQADRDGDRPRPLQAGQRLGRHGGRRLDPAHAWRAGSAGCSSRRIRSRVWPAISSA